MPKLLSVRVKDSDGYIHHVAHDVPEDVAKAMLAGLDDGFLVDQSGKIVTGKHTVRVDENGEAE